jgi:hypothetical protein
MKSKTRYKFFLSVGKEMCVEEIVEMAAAVSIPRQQLRNESAQKSGIQQQ